MFKIYDIIIYFVIAVTITVIGFGIGENNDVHPDKIEVYIDNKLAYVFKVTKEKKIYDIESSGGKARIVSENMTVREVEAPCRNKLCEKQGAISRSGEMIVCIPEKTVIKLSGVSSDVDAVLK